MVIDLPFVLSRGDLRVEIDPGFGGRVTRFWSETATGPIDWLMPTPKEGRDVEAPHKAGMFPLVPFSNRIKDARFEFAGKRYNLEPTEPGRPHAIHGHGYRSVWSVAHKSAHAATLGMSHDGSDWPAAYTVAQRFDLRDRDLVVHLIVDNLGPGPMPIGLGWHPFLPLRRGAEVTASFKTIWPPQQDNIPDGPRNVPPDLDFTKGRVPPAGLDTGFGGWDGTAKVRWSAEEVALVLKSVGPLDHVILYTPANRDFFCLEPVSHPINAINHPPGGAWPGFHVLPAGERFGVSLSLGPNPGPESPAP
jgi:aldose 1-epimerase